MGRPNPFIAKILETSSSAYAAYATNLLFERHPEIEKRSDPGAFRKWKDHLTDRIRELAAAVSEGEPRLFVSRVGWTREAFGARDVPETEIRASLECLREVLGEELPEAARGDASAYVGQALETFAAPVVSSTTELDPKQPNSRLALEYLQAVLEGESRRAIHRVVDAVGNGLGVQEAYLDVLLPAQREVGRMWHLAEAGIAEEHFVTATTRRVMSILCHQAAPADSNGKTVVAAAVAGNVHDMGVRTLSDFFEMAGWRAVCLGADVPPEDVAASVEYFEASLVVLSAVLSTHLRKVRETIETVRAFPGRDVKILVGGIAFAGSPDLWKGLGADGYAAQADEAIALGARLIGV